MGQGPARLLTLPRIEGVSLAAAKPAEDGKGIILRLYDASGAGALARIDARVIACDLLEAPLGPEIPGEALTFRPFEIRSFRVPGA